MHCTEFIDPVCCSVQFENKELVVDTLISAVRFRIGGLLVHLERHAVSHGSLLASLDSEAATWAKLAVPSKASISPIALKYEDLSSSRRLIIMVQGLLFAVPANMRRESVAGESRVLLGSSDNELGAEVRARLEAGLGLTRNSSWLERKTRCDALLSLCNTLMQALQAAAASMRKK
jgi:hypothetical protein